MIHDKLDEFFGWENNKEHTIEVKNSKFFEVYNALKIDETKRFSIVLFIFLIFVLPIAIYSANRYIKKKSRVIYMINVQFNNSTYLIKKSDIDLYCIKRWVPAVHDEDGFKITGAMYSFYVCMRDERNTELREYIKCDFPEYLI